MLSLNFPESSIPGLLCEIQALRETTLDPLPPHLSALFSSLDRVTPPPFGLLARPHSSGRHQVCQSATLQTPLPGSDLRCPLDPGTPSSSPSKTFKEVGCGTGTELLGPSTSGPSSGDKRSAPDLDSGEEEEGVRKGEGSLKKRRGGGKAGGRPNPDGNSTAGRCPRAGNRRRLQGPRLNSTQVGLDSEGEDEIDPPEQDEGTADWQGHGRPPALSKRAREVLLWLLAVPSEQVTLSRLLADLNLRTSSVESSEVGQLSMGANDSSLYELTHRVRTLDDATSTRDFDLMHALAQFAIHVIGYAQPKAPWNYFSHKQDG